MTRTAATCTEYAARLLVVILLVGTACAQTVKSQPDTVDSLRKCLGQRSCGEARQAAYQLAKRKDFAFLIKSFETSDAAVRAYIVEGIYGAAVGHDSPEVIGFMRRVAFRTKPADRLSDVTWYALQFLAQNCDQQALQKLNAHGGDEGHVYEYHVACSDWAESLKELGHCRYEPAKYVLLNSLNSSCLDVVQEARRSLQTLFPGHCETATTFWATKHCYADLWKESAATKPDSVGTAHR